MTDPAAYLKHRVNTLVDVMNRLVRRPSPFHEISFVVRGPAGVAFSYRETSGRGHGTTSTWQVPPELADCAKSIDLGVEIAPDGGVPPCPVP